MEVKTKIKLAVAGVAFFIVSCLIIKSVGIVNVEGTERVVWQKISGVDDTAGEDGLHFYFGFITTPHKYFIGTDTFVVDDKTLNPNNEFTSDEENQFNQPDAAPLEIPVMMDHLTPEDLASGKTTGPTTVQVSCTIQYHLDPTKLVHLHKSKAKTYRTNFLKPVVTRTLNDLITPLDARSVYQGSARIKLQGDIEKSLQRDPQFKEFGVIIERFVLSEVIFKDQEFLGKIQQEALAEQSRKTAIKAMAAHEAEAKSEEAKARSEQNRRLVEAETKKGEEIAQAEGNKAQRVLAAEASKEEARLQGEGIKLKKIAEAEGVLALGKAQAESKRLGLEAYQGEGGRRFAEVEKAKAFGEGIDKIYYIPADMSINTIAKDFENAVTVGLPNAD